MFGDNYPFSFKVTIINVRYRTDHVEFCRYDPIRAKCLAVKQSIV